MARIRISPTLAVFGTVLALSLPALAQVEIPGSARRGERLFGDKGCITCHAIDGVGGNLAPDLGRRPSRTYSPDLIASAMWNHGPAMWKAIAEAGATSPVFTSFEAADLYSYFYSRLYFSMPGHGGRGRAVFLGQGCGNCHDHEARDGSLKVGPPVVTWARVRDPIVWAERMWNHSGRVRDAVLEAHMDWPELSDQQMVDLLVYLRNIPETRSQEATFQPGEPELGRTIFESACGSCHSFGPALASKIDLLDRTAPATLTGYATAMWNHAPLMQAAAADQDLPGIGDGAMTDLIAYLFAERYFFERGDVAKGARVFLSKQCAVCHENDRAEVGAPDLTESAEQYSPIALTRSLWNHGPAMLENLERRGLEWPVFEGDEMRDLIAFLNSRLVRVVGTGN